MAYRINKFNTFVLVFLLIIQSITGQVGVPAGIHYQAVARDNYGKELASTNIDVRFSIITQNPLGPVVYQELHSGIITSKYGVFSLIIGKGTPIGGTYSDLSQVRWSDSHHYLKVEVKFDNSFADMGTMQFMAVPYALFASKSLDPGPQGPKGDPGPQGTQGLKGDSGDPASDDQTLSVINVEGSDYLAISGGNQVKISNIEKDGDPTNEIQDLVINTDKLKITKNPNAVEWDLSPYRQNLTYDPATRVIGITGTTSTVNLSELKNDNDSDPTNEIQDFSYDPVNRKLSLSKSSQVIDLSELKNDNDSDPTNEIQSLTLAGDILSISSSNSVSLAAYKDNTDNQTLTYLETSNAKTLQISGGNTITLSNIVSFRVKKQISTTASSLTDVTFVPSTYDYNDGGSFNMTSGEFTAPSAGIYTFNISYYADGTGGSRKLSVYLKTLTSDSVYEDLAVDIASNTQITTRSLTMKLNSGDIVRLVIYTGTATQTGTGTFSGFRVY
jgi:hypothetical protein